MSSHVYEKYILYELLVVTSILGINRMVCTCTCSCRESNLQILKLISTTLTIGCKGINHFSIFKKKYSLKTRQSNTKQIVYMKAQGMVNREIM